MDSVRARPGWSIALLILLIATIIFVACGCKSSDPDEPLNAQVVITPPQSTDWATLQITNNNWYDWTDVEITIYSPPHHEPTMSGSLGLMESGKTYALKMYLRPSYQNRQMGYMYISVNTVNGVKSKTINLK